jgi:hypothetical protein
MPHKKCDGIVYRFPKDVIPLKEAHKVNKSLELWVLLEVNVEKINSYMRENNSHGYVPEDKNLWDDPKFHKSRMDFAEKLISGNCFFDPPMLSITFGQAGFIDGRHRFAALRNYGKKKVLVLATLDSCEQLHEMFKP